MENGFPSGRIFFIALAGFSLICTGRVYADDPALSLEPIVIRKSAVSLIDSWARELDELSALGVNSLAESLKVFPVDIQSRSLSDGIQADYSLRGAAYQGVLFLIDGQRVNDPQTAHHNTDIPLTRADIEGVEVIPGAASSLYGPDALAGAIQFHLKPPRGESASAEVSGGSFNTHSELMSVTGSRDQLGLRVSAENTQSDGFTDGTDYKKFTTSLYGEWENADLETSLLLGYQEKEFGAYDFYTPARGFSSQEWTKTYLLSTGARIWSGAFIVKPHLLLRRHTDKFLLDKTLTRSLYLNHHLTDLITPSVYLQIPVMEFMEAGVGVEYSQERITSASLGDHSRSRVSLSADERFIIGEDWESGFSLRLDDYQGEAQVYTGSCALGYNLGNGQKLRLGVARNMRLPSFTELYYADPTTAGNPGLRPETATSFEASWGYEQSGLSLTSTCFFRDERDTINWVKRSEGEPLWQAENIVASRTCGIENALRLTTEGGFSLAAYYTYVNKRIDDGGYLHKYGFDYARHQAVLDMVIPLKFVTQGIICSYKKRPGRRGWFLVDARVSRRINEHADVFIEVDNLLNVEYQEIAGIAQPSRWVRAGVKVEW